MDPLNPQNAPSFRPPRARTWPALNVRSDVRWALPCFGQCFSLSRANQDRVLSRLSLGAVTSLLVHRSSLDMSIPGRLAVPPRAMFLNTGKDTSFFRILQDVSPLSTVASSWQVTK